MQKYIKYISPENKSKYGEINTPFELIHKMLDKLPQDIFSDPSKKWLDPGAGQGYFSTIVYNRLFEGLKSKFKCPKERKDYIITKMLYMVEINKEHLIQLNSVFDHPKANIYNLDYLSMPLELSSIRFDVIIGNPPYNSNGLIKVPTNKNKTKQQDGKVLWRDFIKISLNLLKHSTGLLLFITPSIWMKPDKADMYHTMLSHTIKEVHCMSNTETNKAFGGECQTPTSIFLLQNTPTPNMLNIVVPLNDNNTIVNYNVYHNKPIPVFGAKIMSKLTSFVKKYGDIEVIKSSSPSINATITDEDTIPSTKYKNIKTCVLEGTDRTQPVLKINYSDKPLKYHSIPKLVLSHKMYGCPFYDISGIYGISARDHYIITNKTHQEFIRLKEYLSTKFAMYVFESTRYRMKYLEKYAFEIIPNILNIPGPHPSPITDNYLFNLFNLSIDEIELVQTFQKKIYSDTIV